MSAYCPSTVFALCSAALVIPAANLRPSAVEGVFIGLDAPPPITSDKRNGTSNQDCDEKECE